MDKTVKELLSLLVLYFQRIPRLSENCTGASENLYGAPGKFYLSLCFLIHVPGIATGPCCNLSLCLGNGAGRKGNEYRNILILFFLMMNNIASEMMNRCMGYCF